MEDFFIDENFYSTLTELLEELCLEDEDIYALDGAWCMEACESSLEPVFELTLDDIMGIIDEERFDENGEPYNSIAKLLSDNIDFNAINAAIPKVYYATKKTFVITKDDLIEYIKPSQQDDEDMRNEELANKLEESKQRRRDENKEMQ